MAPVEIILPGLLTRFTDTQTTVTVDADTVDEAFDALIAEYPALEPHLFDDHGHIRTHLHVFHNARRLQQADAATTPVDPDDTIRILQAVSGG